MASQASEMRAGTENPCTDMKRAVAKKLIERYFYQLTEGCGNPECDNQNCASSGKVLNLTPNQAAAQAIQLFSQEARLCDGTQPSKVARTSLEPGPASLTNNVSVKNVNPSCSDKGISSNSSENRASLVTDPLTTPVIYNMDTCATINTTNDSYHVSEIVMCASTTTPPKSKSLTNTTSVYGNSMTIQKLAVPPFPKSALLCTQVKLTNDSCFYRFPKSKDIAPPLLSKSMNSDEDIFMKMLNRYKISIPTLEKKWTKKCNARYKNIKKVPTKQRIKNNFRRFKNVTKTERKVSCRKNIKIKSCSRFLTKLLVLALYLRHLERKRYTKH